MTTREQNELLTRTGPGTPGGEMMRRYWLPVGLSRDVKAGDAPLPVRLLSEDLVLFRDDKGRVGLLQRHCPHRRTDLSYGRLEDGGLRCLYHGWLFDVEGNCLDQPAEPPESTYKCEVKARAYPCHEIAGMIFTYMGKGKPPVFPMYSCFKVPEAQRWTMRSVMNCNYLQALEGNIDPAHLSYLHRPMGRVDDRNVPGSNKSADMFYAEDRRPHLDFEETDYGIRIFSIRKAGDSRQYVRVTNFIMPCSAAIVGNEGRVNEGYSMHWHVPIDDHHNARYDLVHNRVRPIATERYDKRFGNFTGPDGVTPRALENRYFQSRVAMQTENYTGMGPSFNVHDAFATESMGPVSDRTEEHLATTDKIIVRARRQLLEGIKTTGEGNEPRGVRREPQSADMSHLVVMSEVVDGGLSYKDIWKTRVVPSQAAE
jgi:phenylpropionate dioxygenase-like ring-hydroxylating dioxygenase large terminal subunit